MSVLKGEKIETYRIGAIKAEGLAVDVPNKRVYVVSDENSELYWYDLP